MKTKSLLIWLCLLVSTIAIEPLVQQAKLTAVDGAASDNFGVAVAVSSDGDTAIVGAYDANVGGNSGRGAAYVYTRSGTIWTEQEKLIAADGAANDNFGVSVALSSDGDTAIVGAYGADVGGNNNQGAVYVFTRSGTAWTQQAKLLAADGTTNDYFGRAVALSGDGNTAIARASFADVGGNENQGAAYVFSRSGATWSQQTKLTASDGATWDYFGTSVDLSTDGDTAIAGAYNAYVAGSSGRGAVYVFTRSGSTWSEQKKLIAADGAADDNFGISAALSGDGYTAIAGAHYADVDGDADQGAAYVFTRSGTAWSEQAKLTAADGAMNDYFGYRVALNTDGNTAIISAYYADMPGKTNQGAAYLFARSGSTWSQQTKLTADDGAQNDYLGISVALSGDGYTAIAGAYDADVDGDANQGAAYVFAVPPPPTGVAASYDLYIDRVRVIWDSISAATGYEVWRGASNDTNQAASIATGITATTYDDTAATPGTDYYYWVKTTNANGASAFSASALGRVLAGPDVRVNGETGLVTVALGSEVELTVSMNPGQDAGSPRDWWLVASTPAGLYYMNNSFAWAQASGVSNLQPAYQGGLINLQSAVPLNTTALPTETYTFYFGVDTLNGSVDPDIVYDSVTVTVGP